MFLCIYENSVSLHPQKGPVAQLNRVSDYGSEGSRFEPWRGHFSKAYVLNYKVYTLFFIYIYEQKNEGLRV